MERETRRSRRWNWIFAINIQYMKYAICNMQAILYFVSRSIKLFVAPQFSGLLEVDHMLEKKKLKTTNSDSLEQVVRDSHGSEFNARRVTLCKKNNKDLPLCLLMLLPLAWLAYILNERTHLTKIQSFLSLSGILFCGISGHQCVRQ